jgi:pilus assembly protein CpaB
MARMRIFIVLVLAIAAGGVFAFATYNYVQQIPGKSVDIPTTKVVVAASDLDVGADLTKDTVRIIDWPSSAAPANAISDPEQVVGRGLVVPMIQNEPFIEGKMAPKDAGAGLPPAIPPGLRAISVKVNEVIGVAGYVLPGTRVDVVATVSPSQSAADMTSKVILTNVEVLTAGTKLERQKDKDEPIAVTVVTLLVDPDQSERLTLASTEGKIQLALRNPLDKATPATRGVKPAGLLGTPSSTPRATARPSSVNVAAGPSSDFATVEVIRGDKRAREAVRQE